jgi:YD repeat-containing protein
MTLVAIGVCSAKPASSTTYEYDRLQRLTKVSYDNGAVVRYEYDAVGNRARSVVTWPLPGDMNCDGAVNFDDINPFVTALIGQEVYENRYPDCRWLNGDCNHDGTVDFDDINPFVKCLVAGGCP